MSDVSNSGVAKGLHCPACRVNLVMSERQGIEIDYCPQCRGVWLDRGELDKIIERSVGDLSSAVQERNRPMPAQQVYGHSSSHDHGQSHGHGHDRGDRHRSFLGRLFD
ncbi:zf-TFIIB domain-containing protein [Shinella sumterensis]|uniref:TFIIB-type zinc ribbon-containing protein n=1 Tax=Rhizobiaceae TaxID=82115 RepID=UPI000BE23440|nr:MULTISPECIES: zf-TFIIB domain-containing protein [Rhizobiaceae]MCW5711725.1 zf-TFIIB domain-containing protein [Shinella sp.]WLS08773.1 zf-TFIIB domain-containing protein [Shinella sumterensis]